MMSDPTQIYFISVCFVFSLSDQLFHVLAMHMRLYSIDSAYNPWTKLTQITQSREPEWVTFILKYLY